MPRASDADNAAIDGFDALLTFAYAYAAEDAHASALGQIRYWASQLKDRVHQSDVAFAFWVSSPTQAVNSAVTSVLNTLFQAVRDGAMRPPVNSALAWLNKPLVLTGADLGHAHRTQRKDIETVFVALRSRLDHAFPPEAKPYVTAEQVGAVLRHLEVNVTVPIHVETAASLMERALRRDMSSGHDQGSRAANITQLVERYVGEAERALVQLVRDQFIHEATEALYPAACRLKVSLDNVFPWGALWRRPLSGVELLQLYAGLNRSRAITDRKFRDTEAVSGILPVDAEAFRRWILAEVPIPQSMRPSNVLFRSTAMAAIQIDGERLVDTAVMTARYDRPLQGLKQNFGYFTNYVVTQRQRYCNEVGIAPEPSELALMAQLKAKHKAASSIERRILHDKSSVLGHIVGIMDADLTHAARTPNLRKVSRAEIFKRVRDAGFDFSLESIRKACDRFVPARDAVYQQLLSSHT